MLILLVLGGPLYRPGTVGDSVVYLGHVLADLPHPLSLCHRETGVEVPYCEGSCSSYRFYSVCFEVLLLGVFVFRVAMSS